MRVREVTWRREKWEGIWWLSFPLPSLALILATNDPPHIPFSFLFSFSFIISFLLPYLPYQLISTNEKEMITERSEGKGKTQ